MPVERDNLSSVSQLCFFQIESTALMGDDNGDDDDDDDCLVI